MEVQRMEKVSCIELTPANMADYGVCGYKDAQKHKELREKINWYERYYPKGLRIKALMVSGSNQGMIEYIPGRYAHRPVLAEAYLFIHCLFVGFKKEYKGRGYASLLLETCIQEARDQHLAGVAVVTRKGSFMADAAIFLKHGFEVVDKAAPDFSLLALTFDEKTERPSFRKEVLTDLSAYQEGLTIMRSVQCPYTEKNVHAIMDSAINTHHLETRLIDLNTADAAQHNPSPFGSFCLIYKGKVISYHPISQTRFETIIQSIK
ncbi:MAG TPA: GNAT family N-acetyltransferase [Bacteroidales bacterium]|nr:GNAT family N-acetyltransferase [Bacteroidales bacterium]